MSKAFKNVCSLQKEIVHLGLEDNDFDNDINPLETTEHLSPKNLEPSWTEYCCPRHSVTTMV